MKHSFRRVGKVVWGCLWGGVLCLDARCVEPPAVEPTAPLSLSAPARDLWQPLAHYPDSLDRNDDLCFLTPDRGWVISKFGRLHRTEDGGQTWQKMLDLPGSYFRCLTFADAQRGWVGTLGLGDAELPSRDPNILYETRDGGQTWQPTTTIQGPRPVGLCGLQRVSDRMIVGCGRVRGPAHFLKTTDGGQTWRSYDLTRQAGMLIAPHFFDEQHGFLIGGTHAQKEQSRALLLVTHDGGETWTKHYESSQRGEYCWKMVFPSPTVGYVSLQRNVESGRFTFLKTTDGGQTWTEHPYAPAYYFIQGIGFVNDSIGWIGGSKRFGTYETRDGGHTWASVPEFGEGLNKFLFFGDSVGYAVGKTVYKLDRRQKGAIYKRATPLGSN